jgi:hypothetical protein
MIHIILIINSLNQAHVVQASRNCIFKQTAIYWWGIDKNDIIGNTFDLEHNIKKEILEEIGIDAENGNIVKGLKSCYLKSLLLVTKGKLIVM